MEPVKTIIKLIIKQRKHWLGDVTQINPTAIARKAFIKNQMLCVTNRYAFMQLNSPRSIIAVLLEI